MTPWLRDLDNVKNFYRRYHDQGFEVLGICLEQGAAAVSVFAASQGLHWPQVSGDTTLARQLGIYGGAANYLIDRDGQIMARNVRGADLTATARHALAH